MNSHCSLSELTVENFKAFAEKRQHMPIRPITLVYGPNSSGKSSLLQAIALAHEAIVNGAGSIDTSSTQLAGESIDLGGFQQYVHRHETNRDVNLGFKLDIQDLVPIFIEFTIGAQTSATSQGILPRNVIHTKRFTVRYKGKVILSFQFDSSGHGRLAQCDWKHPLISGGDTYALHVGIPRGKLLPVLDPTVSNKRKINLSRSCQAFIEAIKTVFSRDLGSLSYLGPLRYFPNRDFSNAPDSRDPNWISGGAVAWERICKRHGLRESINRWLEDKNKLRTPYRLRVRRFEEVDDLPREPRINGPFNSPYVEERLRLVDMRTNTMVSHKDVGIGVSQVLPVLAMALGSTRKLIAIEQPELHLHPAIQAELADVFLQSALKLENKIIIETHSEDLILRILRRIRESAESENKHLSQLKVRPDQVSVVYVQPTDTGSRAFEIPLTNEGEFGVSWPEGFFAERIKELF